MDELDFIAPIPEDRYNDVILHLRNNFMPDEPMCRSVQLFGRGQPHPEMEAHCLETLAFRLSVMAVDKTGQIIAVSLNGITLPEDIQQIEQSYEGITDQKLVQVFTLIDSFYLTLNLFTKYGVDKVFDAHILSVDSNYRGRGLGKKCLEISEKLAREGGFKVMKAEATGVFSQKIFLSLGWECIAEVKYKDYVDGDGKQIFNVDPPHESVKVMVKPIK